MREYGFSTFFCSRDLDLDQMTFMYKLDPYSLEMYRKSEKELPTSTLCKVIRIVVTSQFAQCTLSWNVIFININRDCVMHPNTSVSSVNEQC